MPIVSFNTLNTGQEGIYPRRVTMISTDSLATVTTSGYITAEQQKIIQLNPSDEVIMYYADIPPGDHGALGIFNPFINNDGSVKLVLTSAYPRSGLTPVFGGGSSTAIFSVSGLSTLSVGNCTIVSSTNTVAIAKAVPGLNTLTVTFTGDPGPNTVLSYVYQPIAQ